MQSGVLAQASKKPTPSHASSSQELMPFILDGIAFDVAPRILKRTTVKIPSAEKKAHSKGIVIVRLIVEQSGKPSAPEIMRNTTGSNPLAAAALTAVMGYKFAPATLKNKPVRAGLAIPIVF